MEGVLKALANSIYATPALTVIVKFLKQESLKTSIAHVDAYTLVDWCSVLIQQFAKKPEQWSKWGMDVVGADAKLLETCMGAGNTSKGARVQHSALVTTRRALRSLFRSQELREETLPKLVTALTIKGTASTAGNAVFLGVIAGVSSRLPETKPMLEQHKPAYYTFYIREMIGSRGQLPDHISNALHDFFDSFTTLEELRKELIPPIEKALLRAPEIVLNDIVSPMILALPESFDLSVVLHSNLLKPLLSNIKSTNATIRAGALRTFQALSARSHDDGLVGKIADEILTPLKQGKVPSADQKVLHAQMLASLSSSVPLAQKIPKDIAPVALKEPNEAAVIAEVSTLTSHLTFGLKNGVALDKSVTDTFVKGVADKRIPIRRLWALRAAGLWWDLPSDKQGQRDIQAFQEAILPKLVEIWQEVNANAIAATQNGMVTVGHFVTALLLAKARTVDDPKLVSIYKKSDAVAQSLAIQPKPSFLLNPRVYTKLYSAEDVDIALRALEAVAPWLSEGKTSEESKIAWSQALIYFIAAEGVSSKAKTAARQTLASIYLNFPSETTKIIVDGLWTWYRSIEQADKDSTAVAAKSGTTELFAVLNSFFLPQEHLSKSGVSIPQATLIKQCVDVHILARPQVIPRISWIDLCLRIGVDPGQLARDHLDECMALAIDATEVWMNRKRPTRARLTSQPRVRRPRTFLVSAKLPMPLIQI